MKLFIYKLISPIVFTILLYGFTTPANLVTAAPVSLTLLAAGDFPGPTKPTPPIPPNKVILMPKEKSADNKAPAPKPTSKQQLPPETDAKPRDTETMPPQNTPPKSPTSDTIKALPKKESPNNIQLNTTPPPTEDPSTDPRQIAKPASVKDQFFAKFIRNSIYSILIITILVGIAYIYWTTPKRPSKNIATPKTTSRREESTSLQLTSVDTALPNFLTFADQKIKNKSLLEQLIKYDMETYGELRSNLDYEQPAYVEALIRKYSTGTPDQVNRAVHLFYINRKQNNN